NVSDRRGARAPLALGGGGLIIALIYMFLGGDPSVILNDNTSQVNPSATDAGPGDDADRQFVSVVLADTEDVWNNIFSRSDITYREPHLVLFTDRVGSACGTASSAV